MRYLLTGVFFGFILVKSEVISWFRIQEMFRFDDIHMYGIIGSAVLVAGVCIQFIKRWKMRDIDGNLITIAPKDSSQYNRYILGGIIFGMGWALTGACPGPLYTLTGTGLWIFAIPLTSAIAGAWMYGLLRERLPH
ncbi:DUF6691 family protein [Fodinibius sediminis]|uniref:Uncharacterized protein n=1 Tax=Fodinibius sediminis TaxID=1214077 RepID=A0A521EM44_9BACT|nr:DUF6691 family protein [Fodinibius sediminis]SMO84988.1 hypothetical protein SAMN06265218_11746 [Fodinibius sediminis]